MIQVSMEPDSGLLVYDFLDKPYPVIGFCADTNDRDETVLFPLVLRDGTVARMPEHELKFRLVGNRSLAWAAAVDAHNARIQFEPRADGA